MNKYTDKRNIVSSSREAELRATVRGGNDDAAAELLALVFERERNGFSHDRDIITNVFDGNAKRAVQWMLKNSRGKNAVAAEACFWLGVCYFEGGDCSMELQDVSDPDAVSKKYFVKAFKLGKKAAAARLADCLVLKFYGMKSAKDRKIAEEAFRWAKIAIEENDSYGFCVLGDFYKLKSGRSSCLQLDYFVKKAIACYEKAFGLGCVIASENLYRTYGDLASNARLSRKYARCKKYLELFEKWCNEAIARGSADACAQLAKDYYGNEIISFYKCGRGNYREIPKSHLLKAAELWQRAFERSTEDDLCNFEGCCNAAGTFYELGDSRAFELAKIAANHVDDHNGEGSYFLGLCYKDGIGVEKNSEKAIECFNVAEKKGISFHVAAEQIALIYYEAKDPRAFETLTAIEDPDILARYLLGHCYYDGLGTEKNLQKAREFLCFNKLGWTYCTPFYRLIQKLAEEAVLNAEKLLETISPPP